MKLINRLTKEIICEGDFNNMLELVSHCINNNISLRCADLSGVNLINADLSCANLNGANLSCANLNGANLNGADLRGTNLSGADLSDAKLINAKLINANLRDANLRDANLRNTNLKFCIGNMVDVMSMQLQNYHIVFTKEVLAIGCKQYNIADWKTFDDSYIMDMDSKALDFWKKWKDHIFKTIEMCQ